jgi:hypothetical protein
VNNAAPSRVSNLVVRRLVEDLKGFNPQEQKQVLDVLQKANWLRLARIGAAAAIDQNPNPPR